MAYQKETRSVRRPRLLAVLPYGMALRNILLNAPLWSYLTRTFAIDLVTPVELVNSRDLQISNIVSRPFFERGILPRIRRACLEFLASVDQLAFFMQANEAESFRSIYRYSLIERSTARKLFNWWIGGTRIARSLKGFVKGLVAMAASPDTRMYDVVLLGHNAERECIRYGILANQQSTPVVCVCMGLDNLMHGPLVFVPDLLLVWGEEQHRDFAAQLAFNPECAHTVCVRVGSTIHDTYLNSGFTLDVNKLYALESEDTVILFPAYVEKYLPFQVALCEVVLDYIRRSPRKLKLLVRLRPGFDEQMWRDLQDRYPHEVRLQIPLSSSFDKSGNVQMFDVNRETEDVELFAATLRRVAVLVTPTFSTMETDAHLFGKPSINAIFNPECRDERHPNLTWYLAGLAKTPEWGSMMVATSREELHEYLAMVLERVTRDSHSMRSLFEFRATAADGRAGERAVSAIRDFISVRRTA